MKHETQMLAAVRVVALTWSKRGTTQYPLPFVQALSDLFREAYFVEHGQYPAPPTEPSPAAAPDDASEVASRCRGAH